MASTAICRAVVIGLPPAKWLPLDGRNAGSVVGPPRCWVGARRACRPSERLQVAIELPLRDVESEVVPFGLLGLEEMAEHVLAEGLADDEVRLELLDRLPERTRHLPDPHLGD